MMTVRNSSDARQAHWFIEHMKGLPGAEEIIKGLKKEIRGFFRRQDREKDRRIVKDYGIDGYIELIELPKDISTLENAKEYVEEYETIKAIPSAYDCTGQAFTSWTKTFERQGRFFAYRSVSFDV